MLRAPASTHVVLVEAATRALVSRSFAVAHFVFVDVRTDATVRRGLARSSFVAVDVGANATMRLRLAVLALVARINVGADAFVRRGLAVFALVARLNVAAAASVMRRRLAICALKLVCQSLCVSGLKRDYCPRVWLKSIKLVGWPRCVNTAIYCSARVPESGVRESD